MRISMPMACSARRVVGGARPLAVGLCILVALSGGCASTRGPGFDAGPVVSVDRDLHGNPRVRALGPFIEMQRGEGGNRFTAVRPFCSKTTDVAADRSVTDIVWPLGMIKERKGETDWRLFPAFGHDFDSTDAGSRHRWSVFPFLFGGEDVNGKKYFAFFPIAGTMREFMMQDYAFFFCFPLYVYREQEDNKTRSVLWPIVSWTTGNDVSRWRVFPFYGVSRNTERWTKRFVLWPFWTSVQYHYPNQKGGGFVLFPLFGKFDVGEERRSRMLLPPFFKWERGEGGHLAVNCPWPLFQYRRGEIDRLYLWPLVGREQMENERQWFILWPFISGRRTDRREEVVRHFQAVPLVYYESKTRSGDMAGAAAEAVSARYFKLWPLLSYRREEDVSRLRVLALWPLKHTPGIERNWAPLWSLYSRARVGEAVESELLWGMYRRRHSGEGNRLSVFPLLQTSSEDGALARRSWSLLYGLLGYQREGLHKQFRLLYFIKFGTLSSQDQNKEAPGTSHDNT